MRSSLRLSRDLSAAFTARMKSEGDIAHRLDIPMAIQQIRQLDGEVYEVSMAQADSFDPLFHGSLLERQDASLSDVNKSQVLIAEVLIPYKYPGKKVKVIQWIDTNDVTLMNRRHKELKERQMNCLEQSRVPDYIIKRMEDAQMAENGSKRRRSSVRFRLDHKVADLTDETKEDIMRRKGNIVKLSEDMLTLVKAQTESTADRTISIATHGTDTQYDPKNYPWALTVEYGTPKRMLKVATITDDDKIHLSSLPRVTVENRKKVGIRASFPLIYP